MSTEGRMIRRCSSTPSSSEHHRKSSELRLRPFFKTLELNVEDSLVIPDGGHPESSQPDKRRFHFAPVLWPALFLWLGTLSSAIWNQWLPDQTHFALWIACSFSAIGLVHRDLSGFILLALIPFFLGICLTPSPWQAASIPEAPVRISGEIVSAPRFIRTRNPEHSLPLLRARLDRVKIAGNTIRGQTIIEWPADLNRIGRGARISALLTAGDHTLRKVSRFGGIQSDQNEGLFGTFDKIRQTISIRLQPITGGWASALVLGERKLLPPEVIEQYRQTGLAHLLAISGLHMGLLLRILRGLGHRLPTGLQPYWRPILPLTLILQTLISGADAPAIRAATTALLVGWGFNSGRVLSPLHTLTLCTLIWCMTGKAPPDPGATISLAAISALMLLKAGTTSLEAMGLHPPSTGPRWISTLRSGYVAFLGAHAALVWWSPLICLWGPVLTLLILPWVTGVILLTYCSMIFSPWIALENWSPFWNHLRSMLIHLPDLFDQLPGTPITLIPWSPVSWTLIFVLSVLILTGRIGPRSFLWPAVGIPLVFSLWLPFCLQEPGFHIELLSRGRGQALFIDDGQTRILFDAGDTSSHDGGFTRIQKRLWNRGVRQVDALFLSHPHLDHQGAVPGLIQQGMLKRIFVTNSYDSFPTGRSMLKLARNQKIPITRINSGQIWQLGDFRITISCAGIPMHLNPTANDLSPLVLIDRNGQRLLTTGDATAPVLTSTRFIGPIHHALLPHHGAPTEGLDAWLETLQPEKIWVARNPPIPRQTKHQFAEYSGFSFLFHGDLSEKRGGIPRDSDDQFQKTRQFMIQPGSRSCFRNPGEEAGFIKRKRGPLG